jgi:hypothetical protein
VIVQLACNVTQDLTKKSLVAALTCSVKQGVAGSNPAEGAEPSTQTEVGPGDSPGEASELPRGSPLLGSVGDTTGLALIYGRSSRWAPGRIDSIKPLHLAWSYMVEAVMILIREGTSCRHRV